MSLDDDKLVRFDAESFLLDSGDLELYALTRSQALGLVSAGYRMAWSTRWTGDTYGLDIGGLSDDTVYNLMNPLDICALIANCINNSDAVRSALTQWFENNATNLIDSRLAELSAREVVGTADDCKDSQFAMIRALHDELNASNLDFFENIESYTNTLELISDFSEELTVAGSAVGGVGAIVGAIVGYGSALIDFFLESVTEQYEAAYTTELRDEICCELMCKMQRVCYVSIDDFIEYHESKLSIQSLVGIDNIISWFLGGTFLGDEIVHATMLLQLYLARLANIVFKTMDSGFAYGLDRLAIILEASSDEVDNDWGVLCPVCPLPSARFEWVVPSADVVDSYTVANYDLSPYPDVLNFSATSDIFALSATLFGAGSSGTNGVGYSSAMFEINFIDEFSINKLRVRTLRNNQTTGENKIYVFADGTLVKTVALSTNNSATDNDTEIALEVASCEKLTIQFTSQGWAPRAFIASVIVNEV